MSVARALRSVRRCVTWEPNGTLQQTLAAAATRSGTGLHSGAQVTIRLLPALAGDGRYFVPAGGGTRIPASFEYAVDSPLCTELHRGDAKVRTVEHLLSALEGIGVDNCRIEVDGGDEIPILDGSAKEWLNAIKDAGLCPAEDKRGQTVEKLAPKLHDTVHVCKDDSFIVAFPSSQAHVAYAINFDKVPVIGCQFFSSILNSNIYSQEIASSRTFCIFEEVEKMRSAGLIKGGSLENALVCSVKDGWLNPPLHYNDEPCRHKILDLVGDLSLFARDGHQGLPVARITAYKAGHALHVEFIRRLHQMIAEDEE